MIFLLLLLGLMLEPSIWVKKVYRPGELSGGEAALSALSAKSLGSPGVGKTEVKPAGKRAMEEFMDTGAGREIPGEKALLFRNEAAYQRFLDSAPAGMILGRIDGLRAVRVRDGSWLDALAASGDMTSGRNYHVQVPQVPVEVRTMGDAVYRVVGSKALNLLGAEGVTAEWGKNVPVALLDTKVSDSETLVGAESGHGTSMKSLIAGGSGVVQGAAPKAQVTNFPVLDGEGKGNSFTLAQAIVQAVDGGAQVINMSLGSDGDSAVVRAAVAYALSKNVALVAAAGNEAVNRVSYPAAYEGVLAVASVDGDRQQLYFSNRGSSVGVAAPGFAVVADWPGGKTVEVSGTSASTALVSGVVAALLSKEPGLTGTRAVELLRQYADDTGAVGRDDETGHGVVDLQRVLERNQRGIIDLAVAGVKLDPAGKLTVAVQNRGTETVNSPVLEIGVGGNSRKFYLGSLAPGQSVAESVQFDPVRAKQDGGIAGHASVQAPRGLDQRPGNDLWSGYFKISK
ncbi:MAG: hypothetical protein EBT57_04635 [Verrucomicrobia bacterium]|nr:hypothetical protein [Verrucomicrobiota bacterium]